MRHGASWMRRCLLALACCTVALSSLCYLAAFRAGRAEMLQVKGTKIPAADELPAEMLSMIRLQASDSARRRDRESLTDVPSPTYRHGTCLSHTDLCEEVSLSARDGIDGVSSVHVVIANRGQILLLENMLCSMRRVGMRSLAVLAMDAETCPYLLARGFLADARVTCVEYLCRMIELMKMLEPRSYSDFQAHVDKFSNRSKQETPSLRSAAKIGTYDHKFLVNAKLYAAMDVLNCGVGAFVTDVDVVFLKDPFPEFRSLFQKKQSLTMIFQDERNFNSVELSLNTGFFYMLPGEHNINFMRASIQVPPWWWVDQVRINTLLAWSNYSSPGCWHRLDTDTYPNGAFMNRWAIDGKRWDVNLDPRLSNIVAAHVNWNTQLSDKLKVLSQTGLWLLLDTEECWTGLLPAPEITGE